MEGRDFIWAISSMLRGAAVWRRGWDKGLALVINAGALMRRECDGLKPYTICYQSDVDAKDWESDESKESTIQAAAPSYVPVFGPKRFVNISIRETETLERTPLTSGYFKEKSNFIVGFEIDLSSDPVARAIEKLITLFGAPADVKEGAEKFKAAMAGDRPPIATAPIEIGDWHWASSKMLDRRLVRRKSWPEHRQVYLREDPFGLTMSLADGGFLRWCPGVADFEATDWVLYDQ